jgi:hypothetical protein
MATSVMKTPVKINTLYLEATCIGISQRKWDMLMQGATRANKSVIDRLVKLHFPKLYAELCLNCYNPYKYYKTKTHLILVHSSVEYFLRYY